MRHPLRMVTAVLALAVGFVGLAGADDPPSESREIPEPFAPFETMIGSWKGTGFYLANRIRGWNETHAWAWKFEKGTPVGLSVTFTGSKLIDKATITFDDKSKTYNLVGTDPKGEAVKFTGKLDKTGKGLELTRLGKTADGAKQRLDIIPNGNLVRYTLKVQEQEAGAPQFKPTLEAGLTKEGESFAAGSSGGDLPKCIITGGASTLSVTYEGKTYPLCCTGCRDEFNENPEKYIKKAALTAEAADKTKVMPATVTTPVPAGETEKTADETKPTKGEPKPKAEADDDKKVRTLLRMGQNLEKANKAKSALTYYRQIVKDFPKSTAAKTASERIKALGGGQ